MAPAAETAEHWAQLLPEQQERLTTLGVQPTEAPSPTLAAGRAAKAPSKAQQAFQRGLTALTQWVERESGDRPVPRGHSEKIAVSGEAEPMVVKLGVWISNTKTRRDKLTQEQLEELRELGMEWARDTDCGWSLNPTVKRSTRAPGVVTRGFVLPPDRRLGRR